MSKLMGVLFFLAFVCELSAQPGVPQNLTFTVLFDTEGKNKLNMPVAMAQIPTRPGSFLVCQKTGEIVLLHKTSTGPEAKTIATIKVLYPSTFVDEFGLLGIAFHPQFPQNRLYYISYMQDDEDNNRLIIEERKMGENLISDEGHAVNIITIEQSLNNHNAGTIGFGPDNMLYISVGDGGEQEDPDNRAQTLSSPMGKILRINVDDKKANAQYTVPPDNPFVTSQGALPEIWAYGLRNPWKWSFDRLTGEMWVGDVGYWDWEEISIVTKGANMGWKVYEGYSCLDSSGVCSLAGHTEPIVVFDREESTSITGGVVFRGNPDSPLYGTYFCADYGYGGRQGSIWVVVKNNNGGYSKHKVSSEVDDITSFYMDRAGNIYVLSQQGMVYQMEHPDLVPVSLNPFHPKFPNMGKPHTLFSRTPLLTEEILSNSWKIYSSNGKPQKVVRSSEEWKTLGGRLSSGLYFASIEGQSFSYVIKWAIP